MKKCGYLGIEFYKYNEGKNLYFYSISEGENVTMRQI